MQLNMWSKFRSPLYLQTIDKQYKNSMIDLYMAENHYLSAKTNSGDQYMNNFITLNFPVMIENLLKSNLNPNNILPFISSTMMTDIIHLQIKDIENKYENN